MCETKYMPNGERKSQNDWVFKHKKKKKKLIGNKK